MTSEDRKRESEIFEAWKKNGFFSRSKGKGKNASDSYTITIPPPNITGVLHMGHALNDTIQDACIRRARMQGYQTRWVLGTDHAGIATQTKVDKHLAEQGINRREIGREKFIEACQEWRREYGTTIVNQIAGMGCSCDYDQEQFTMSDEFSRAVRKLFVDWYNDGIIYRGKRIVNWCPHCTTAIADDEAEYQDEASHLWYMRYPLKEPVDGIEYLVVATTRPETMLGDTGVAVSPKDKRYKNLVGKTVVLPIVNREIPIFEDFYVDAEFGTGCVKTTPAHDPNDYAMGQRNDLEVINIFDETAHVVEGYGRFSGMDRDEARVEVVKEFEKLGLLDHIEDLNHSVMHCYRCHTTLEPWLSEQWFVDVEKIKGAAREAVATDEIKFYPSRWKQVYLDWLDNLKDWCISRQLWWGHRIPMFYCDECGWEGASVDPIDTCPKCGGHVHQDEDVLDTWFSSQLWPFATQGWANGGEQELAERYPTQVLSTARDIMGLWVARMVMASEYCTGQIPFKEVIIHPTVMGADGKPMSKSRGNGVDPLALMENYSADGMRFGLLTQVTGNQAVNFDERKIEGARNFANKVRNAARYVTMNLDEGATPKANPATLTDKWILSKLAKLVANVDAAYAEYDFGAMTQALYQFFWNEFCDWYIEFSKARLAKDADPADKAICQGNLLFILETACKLLHPVMPFITEEIYAEIKPGKAEDDMLIVADWPEASDLAQFIDNDSEMKIELVTSIVASARSVRARYGISPKNALKIVVKADAESAELINNQAALINKLANYETLEVAPDAQKPQGAAVVVTNKLEIYFDISEHVDLDAEKKRLEKKIAETKKDMDKLEKKLNNPGFLAKAAQEIIDKDKAHFAELKEVYEKATAQLEGLN
ncbi:MAG: valine--tRNA ligase [Phoenicibacter congonensis]|uniref:Valine--tRNA ligase n=1 Tax=Phoenicibacter congonensis TaxID=1944646 RepID=A0AA43RGC2_9ACTN|nr:valine--tRNA ligase [Phoenicibacter congonensis]